MIAHIELPLPAAPAVSHPHLQQALAAPQADFQHAVAESQRELTDSHHGLADSNAH